MNASFDSDLGSSNDKLDEAQPESWLNFRPKVEGLKSITPQSLSDQLKERLAERAGYRLNEDGSPRDSSDENSDLNRNQSPAALSQTLLCEIKKAVNEAAPGKINFDFVKKTAHL